MWEPIDDAHVVLDATVFGNHDFEGNRAFHFIGGCFIRVLRLHLSAKEGTRDAGAHAIGLPKLRAVNESAKVTVLSLPKITLRFSRADLFQDVARSTSRSLAGT